MTQLEDVLSFMEGYGKVVFGRPEVTDKVLSLCSFYTAKV